VKKESGVEGLHM